MTTVRDEAGLIGIGTSPNFGIGQRALLVQTPDGNILWDCISLVEPAAVALIKGLGGLAAIAISHPHYYTTMLEWSRAFGGVPVHLHAADRAWVMRNGPEIVFWEGDSKTLAPGLTLIRCGGHFEGGTVLHHAAGAAGRGALLSGDILQVVADRAHLGFMRSYPNFIPLGAAAVRAIAARLQPWSFDAIYGAFWNGVIPRDAMTALTRSVQRHIDWLGRDAL
ncbi:MBL fold metallo-hydrolase [Rhodopila sp.]|uniref:MBL fold metallo-hydrolase n=1 Tax=Rhodopila sp. TaxID=2480087 RepID=UPI003D11569A